MNNVMTDNNTINAKLDLLLAMTSANAGSPEYTRGKETTLDELALIWFDLKKNSVCESSYGSYLRQYQTISKKFGKCYLATIKRKDFVLGVDFRKAGRITLITTEAMIRVYGELEE